jgi:hypothetical protein
VHGDEERSGGVRPIRSPAVELRPDLAGAIAIERRLPFGYSCADVLN